MTLRAYSIVLVLFIGAFGCVSAQITCGFVVLFSKSIAFSRHPSQIGSVFISAIVIFLIFLCSPPWAHYNYTLQTRRPPKEAEKDGNGNNGFASTHKIAADFWLVCTVFGTNFASIARFSSNFLIALNDYPVSRLTRAMYETSVERKTVPKTFQKRN